MKVTRIESARRRKGRVRVFGVQDDHKCVWMKAGVINFKLCDNAYDCLNCAFDKAMTRRVQKNPDKQQSWREPLRGSTHNTKACRHMLTGKVAFRLCGNAYNCDKCEFDQWLETQTREEALGDVGVEWVEGFALADDYYYHRGHTWARVEHGGLVRLGVDDFTHRLLGYMTAVKLPRLGSHLEFRGKGWVLRREEKMAAMESPLAGIVVARNHRVMDDPEIIKADPYGEGWLVVIEPVELVKGLRSLLVGGAARAWLTTEGRKLQSIAMPTQDLPMAATGGRMIEDIYGNLRHLKWDALVDTFLRT